MEKKLVIVESPAKAKTIGKILGKDYIIRASMGHIRDLPERAFGVDIANGFQPQYEESKSRSKNLSDLKSSAKAANEIFLASDPDREGEAIAWHLREVLSKLNKKAPFRRVSFHEITRSAIQKAFEHPGDVDMDLVDAQQARRVLDRIVGYQISPLLWTRIERGVSAGRVQSVALRLVCEREREIQAFIPKEYWNFEAEFLPENAKESFRAKLAKIDGAKFEINNQTDSDSVIRAVRSVNAWKAASIDVQPRKKYAPPPFITSTLQQAASSALGFSASQTMRIAQQLYEGVDTGNGPIGLITYMRTDAVAVAAEAQNACRNFVSANYGPDFIPEKPNFYRSKNNAQGAHEAIRPTDVNITPESIRSSLEPQQYKLYLLIWRRFVASQMSPARQERTTVQVEGAGADKHVYSFRASATVTKFPGYLRAWDIVEEGSVNDEEDDENRYAAVLGAIRENQPCQGIGFNAEQKFTEPAPRFSEATLIKELELNGIGRPSTYATIVNTIQTRHYVEKEKGKLIPTDLGFRINDYLIESLPELFQVGFTADMEELLDHVEEGKIQWTQMLSDFYEKFSLWLQSAKDKGAPPSDKTVALLTQLENVPQWEKIEKTAGHRAFNEQRFFKSIQDKFKKDSKISEKQWDALLALAVKYRSILPELDAVAKQIGFMDELQAAADKIRTRQEEFEERQAKREAAQAAAPAQPGIARIFEAMKDIKWQPAEKRRGRDFDDNKFFESLRKQSEAGKALSEKQLAALAKIFTKYGEQIPAYNELAPLLGMEVKPEETEADNDEKRKQVEDLLRAFENVTQWAEPVKRGRYVYDDKEFVASIRKQASAGKVLSDKQVAALNRLAAKYSL